MCVCVRERERKKLRKCLSRIIIIADTTTASLRKEHNHKWNLTKKGSNIIKGMWEGGGGVNIDP